MTGPASRPMMASLSATGFSLGGSLALLVFLLFIFGLLTAFSKAVRLMASGKREEVVPSADGRAAGLHRLLSLEDQGESQLVLARIFWGGLYFIWGAADSLPKLLALTGAGPGASGLAAGAGFALLLLFVFLLFGYEIPRRAAGRKEGILAKRTWFIMAPLLGLARILGRLVALIGRLFLSLTRIGEVEEAQLAPTEAEFLQMLEAGHARGAIEDDNRELIANLFEFDDKIAGEIMTHRTEIEALPVEANLEETMSFLNSTRYTRFPVYKDTIDKIIGLLHVKDLLFYREQTRETGDFSLADIMRPAWFTPETRNISDLFRDMQENHIQMAIVIDEYGGTAGLLTIEDLVEQIVGNIEDEYDEGEQDIIEIAPGSWLVDGSFPVDRLARITGVPLGDDDYDTLAGLIIELLDRIPEEQERPMVHYGPLAFQVLDVSDKRIVRVRVTRTCQKEEEGHDHD